MMADLYDVLNHAKGTIPLFLDDLLPRMCSIHFHFYHHQFGPLIYRKRKVYRKIDNVLLKVVDLSYMRLSGEKPTSQSLT